MNTFLKPIPNPRTIRYSPENLEKIIILDDDTPLTIEHVISLIQIIFETENFINFAEQQILNSGIQFNTIVDFMKLFDDFFNEKLNPNSGLDHNLRSSILLEFENFQKYKINFFKEYTRYFTSNKINKNAVHWPNPTGKYPGTTEGANLVIENFNLVDKHTPIGSAGSCFADEMAYYFQKKGYNYVITERLGNNSEDSIPNSCAAWGVLFNTPSFMQVAERAFGEADFPPLIDRIVMDDIVYYHDPYRENVVADSPETIHLLRSQHVAAARKAFETCEVFIITLGLNECFQNIYDGTIVSRNPKNVSSSSLLNHKILTLQENIDCLQRFLDIIRVHNPTFKLIVTVSPVPFMATGRADTMHVITANTHSKSVLRVAAEEFVNRNENVWYFPAYEVVTVATRDPWEDDLRHVKRSTVARVMRTFERMYVKGIDPRLDDEIDRITD